MDESKALKALAYVSLVFGGFLIVTYLAFCYSAIWQHEFLPIFPEAQAQQRFAQIANSNTTASPFPNDSIGAGDFRPQRFRAVDEPLAVVFSPQAIAVLLTGVLFLVNSYFLLKHLKRKEHRETKRFVTSSLLTDEEKAVYDELIKTGGEATQKQLALNTGFSAVKVYRVLKRLEGKKVVTSFPYGMTKKIILNES